VSIQRIFLLLLVAVYSIALLLIEWQTSQTYIRQFVTDIQGDVFFYAINTTFSVFLLWATALLFGLCLFCLREQEQKINSKGPPPNSLPQGTTAAGISISNLLSKIQQRQDYFFYLSQILLFTYLGFDERFLIHETIGLWLGRNDAYLLLGLGFVEIGLLIWLGNLTQKPKKARYFLYSAAIFFGIMVVIDALFPSKMVLRLSLEELTKLWADICLFLFAWEILIHQIRQLECKKE
jgi:hypothetical protein